MTQLYNNMRYTCRVVSREFRAIFFILTLSEVGISFVKLVLSGIVSVSRPLLRRKFARLLDVRLTQLPSSPMTVQ